MAAKARDELIRDRERTENALINAAQALISEHPYESIRVRDIAEAVGCNHGLITHYFGGKLGLFTTVLHRLGDEINATIVKHPSAQTVLNHPSMAAYWRLLAALLDAGLDPTEALNEGQPAVESLVRRGSELAGRTLESTRHLAGFIMLMVGGYHLFGDVFASTLRPTNDHPDPIESFQQLITIILQGVSVAE